MIKLRNENSRLRSHVDVDDILKLRKLNGTSLSHPTAWGFLDQKFKYEIQCHSYTLPEPLSNSVYYNLTPRLADGTQESHLV